MAQPTTPPSEPLVSISTFDLLLIELIPLAERMTREYEASLDRPSLANTTSNKPPRTTTTTSAPTTTATTSNAIPNPPAPSTTANGLIPTTIANDGLPETEVFKETMHYRLERLGFRVGQGLSERFSRDRPRFTDQLDVIKFLCKDLWTVVFKKQIDNLKTNHRGVFVLTDSKFRPFSRMSMASSAEALTRAQIHLVFPCGILRGALSSLGIQATVQAETTELPTATFQIKTSTAKG